MFDQKEKTHCNLFIYNGLNFTLVTALGLSSDDPLHIGLIRQGAQAQSPDFASQKGFYSAVKIGLAALIPFVLG
ncbi:MAG: hypothetical protein IM571_07940 [Chitinophagaceae bacterium]|jgi:hypothetical protein|nr:hypothetical protein [Chitinophagaceae bacterium]